MSVRACVRGSLGSGVEMRLVRGLELGRKGDTHDAEPKEL